jgi:hypothetical protein
MNVSANITSPKNGSGVPREIDISGTIQGLETGQRAFLCIQSTTFGKYIFPQGEIIPDSQGNWIVKGIYQSVNYEYRTYVIVTDNQISAEKLTDPYHRSNGFPALPVDTIIVSPIIVVIRI